jgi:ankyrin repeat protein
MKSYDEILSKELIRSCKDGEYDQIIDLLKNQSVDVNLHEQFTLNSPLHYLSVDNRIDVAQLLVASGANLNVLNGKLNSPLHKAAENDKLDMVELLIASGANVNLKNFEGNTARDVAISDEIKDRLNTDSDSYNALRQINPDLIKVCSSGDIDQLRDILSNPLYNINYQDSDYRKSALHYAAGGGFESIVLLLVAAGARVDITDAGQQTPLHGACLHKHINIIQLLLAAGAQVDAQDADRGTSLHYASSKGATEVVKLLLSAQATVDLADKVLALLIVLISSLSVVLLGILDRPDVRGVSRPLEGRLAAGGGRGECAPHR